MMRLSKKKSAKETISIYSLRKDIEKIDAQLIKNLAARKKLAKQIGVLKKKLHRTITDKKRENNLMKLYRKLCSQHGIEFSYVKKVFGTIMQHSKKSQKNV